MRRLWLLFALLLVLPPASAPAQEAGRRVVKTGVMAEDLYLAGEWVEVRGDAKGDVVAAGRVVAIDGGVGGDVLAAGGSVTVAGEVRDDVRAVGRLVLVEARVADGLVAAGEVIRVLAAARVGGAAWLAGRRIDIAGHVGKGLRVAAARIRISGTIEGDVALAARDIEILPTARIQGRLTYWSGQEARIDPAARIAGRVIHRQPEFLDRAGRVLTVIGTATRVVFIANLFVIGVVLLLLFPGLTVSASRTIGREPWASVGVGFALLVGLPLLAAFLVFTVVGAPLGLAAIALWVPALLVGVLTAAFFLGEVGARLLGHGTELTRGRRVLSLLAAVVVLALARFVPILGNLVLLAALVAGLGAWTLCVYRDWAGQGEISWP